MSAGLAAVLGREGGLARAAARRPALASLGLGLVGALALPPVHAVVALFGLAPFLWLVRRAPDRRRASWLGWCYAFGFHLAGVYWVAFAFVTDAERFGSVPLAALAGGVAVLGLAAAMAAFAAPAAGIVRAARLRSPLATAFLFALAWTALEVARDLLTTFPWNPVGSVWAASDTTLQPAAFVGVYGLSLATVAAAAAPLAWIEGGRRAPALLPALLLAAAFALGAARLPAGPGADVAGVRLRLVQGAVDQTRKWDPELRPVWFRRHLELSARPSATPPTAVVWPESASSYLLGSDATARALIARVTPPGGVTLAGGERFVFGPDGDATAAWNSLFALDDAGRVVGTYDKADLVPFGEYLPFRPFLGRLGLGALAERSVGFRSGPGRRLLTAPGLPPFSPLICYEAAFTGRVTPPSGARPGWLLNVTNDAWFGRSSGPYQHLAAARLRAVEEGLPLIRAANTGVSAAIDPYGRVRDRLPLGVTGALDVALPAAIDPPPYARMGALCPLLLAAAFALTLLAVEARARRARP